MTRTRRRRAYTLLETLMAGWIAVSILSITCVWVVFTIEVVERDSRAAVREAERDALALVLREDLGSACRLIPDQSGRGFALELPSEASVSGRQEPDYVVYDCEPRQEGPVLVRSVFPGGGAPPAVRRLSVGVAGCRASLEGSSWRAQVTWHPSAGGPAEAFVVETGARVRAEE